MAKLSNDRKSGTRHPRENILNTGTLASNGAEFIIETDGCASFTFDARGTFNLTFEVSGQIDNANWQLIPVRPINQASVLYALSVAGSVQGSYAGECGGYDRIRVRCTAFTSGSLTGTLAASTAPLSPLFLPNITPSIGTITAASGAIATLTLASPGAGLRHYLTYIAINRFAAAVLTAAAAPVLVTTTNIPGTLVFSRPADAALLGTMDSYREDFAYPVAVSAQATATTIVGPATTGVIWRITAGFFVAP